MTSSAGAVEWLEALDSGLVNALPGLRGKFAALSKNDVVAFTKEDFLLCFTPDDRAAATALFNRVQREAVSQSSTSWFIETLMERQRLAHAAVFNRDDDDAVSVRFRGADKAHCLNLHNRLCDDSTGFLATRERPTVREYINTTPLDMSTRYADVAACDLTDDSFARFVEWLLALSSPGTLVAVDAGDNRLTARPACWLALTNLSLRGVYVDIVGNTSAASIESRRFFETAPPAVLSHVIWIPASGLDDESWIPCLGKQRGHAERVRDVHKKFYAACAQAQLPMTGLPPS